MANPMWRWEYGEYVGFNEDLYLLVFKVVKFEYAVRFSKFMMADFFGDRKFVKYLDLNKNWYLSVLFWVRWIRIWIEIC